MRGLNWDAAREAGSLRAEAFGEDADLSVLDHSAAQVFSRGLQHGAADVFALDVERAERLPQVRPRLQPEVVTALSVPRRRIAGEGVNAAWKDWGLFEEDCALPKVCKALHVDISAPQQPSATGLFSTARGGELLRCW